MSQPFTMSVSYDSGILHFSLMGTGEIGYYTKAKCFEVKDFHSFFSVFPTWNVDYMYCHIHIEIDSVLTELSRKAKENVNSK